MEQPFRDYLNKFYYDTITYSSPVLAHLLQVAGYAQVMFGTDHPFDIADPQAGKAAIVETVASDNKKNALLRGTAERWIMTGKLEKVT